MEVSFTPVTSWKERKRKRRIFCHGHGHDDTGGRVITRKDVDR